MSLSNAYGVAVEGSKMLTFHVMSNILIFFQKTII